MCVFLCVMVLIAYNLNRDEVIVYCNRKQHSISYSILKNKENPLPELINLLNNCHQLHSTICILTNPKKKLKQKEPVILLCSNHGPPASTVHVWRSVLTGWHSIFLWPWHESPWSTFPGSIWSLCFSNRVPLLWDTLPSPGLEDQQYAAKRLNLATQEKYCLRLNKLFGHFRESPLSVSQNHFKMLVKL